MTTMRIPLVLASTAFFSGLALCGPLLAQAGAAFGPPQALPPMGFPIEAVDFDGDGDLDLLTRVNSSGALARFGWVENLGAGVFGSDRLIGVSTPIVDPTVIDFDGDGDLDLALIQSGRVYWFERTGAFTFGQVQTVLNVTSSFSAIVADLDGDGDADIAAADYIIDRVVTFENTGSGFAGPVEVATTGYLPNVLEAGDFDSDGDVDFLWTSQRSFNDSTPLVGLPVNNGDGTFTSNAMSAVGTPGVPFAGQFIDLDGDGDLDVHTALFEGGGVWYQNGGAGGFSQRQTSPLVSNLRLIDMDGDGDLDFIDNGLAVTGLISWHEMFVAQAAQLPLRSGAVEGATAAHSVLLGMDVDGDGDQDLFCLEGGTGAIVLLENRLLGAIGTQLCDPAVPNSTGQPATITAEGSLFLSDGNVTLRAAQLPPNATSLFLASRLSSFVANPAGSQGNLCLGGAIGRYVGPGQIQNSGPGGTMALSVDLGAMPTPNGFVAAAPGETWFFQAWNRDANPGATSNFTSVVAIQPRD